MVLRATCVLAAVAGCDIPFDIDRLPEPDPDAAGAPGLVAWYPLDMIDGTDVLDFAGDHDGFCSLSQCPLPVPGRRAGAMSFDGTKHIRVLSKVAGGLETTTAFTVMLFLSPEEFGPETRCPISKLFGTGIANSWQLCFSPSAVPTVAFTDGTTGDLKGASATVALDVWRHYALTWDGSEKRLYIDASMAIQSSGDIAFDGGEILIGADINNATVGNLFIGKIDDVRIYNRAMTQAEILAFVQE